MVRSLRPRRAWRAEGAPCVGGAAGSSRSVRGGRSVAASRTNPTEFISAWSPGGTALLQCYSLLSMYNNVCIMHRRVYMCVYITPCPLCLVLIMHEFQLSGFK